MVGLASPLQLIPAALIAPVGSVLGDRHRRERVLLYAYASLSATTTLAAVALLTTAPAPLVYASATTAGWMITLVRPTHASLLPRVARTPEELSSAFAASSLLESFSILLGPLLAGGLMALAPGSLSRSRVVDAALAAMLFLGTVSVASIRVRTEPAKEGGTSGVRVVASDAVEGVRAVAQDRRSLLLMATVGLSMVQLGFVDVLIVVLAVDSSARATPASASLPPRSASAPSWERRSRSASRRGGGHPDRSGGGSRGADSRSPGSPRIRLWRASSWR
ncbi:MAG: crp [Actinomycetia bacterium]|jgi:MFS family permease|nr:crp [Actinomycetes bacterium]